MILKLIGLNLLKHLKSKAAFIVAFRVAFNRKTKEKKLFFKAVFGKAFF